MKILPENSQFPKPTRLEETNYTTRSQAAIHSQLCVIADLLRTQIELLAAIERDQ